MKLSDSLVVFMKEELQLSVLIQLKWNHSASDAACQHTVASLYSSPLHPCIEFL